MAAPTPADVSSALASAAAPEEKAKAEFAELVHRIEQQTLVLDTKERYYYDVQLPAENDAIKIAADFCKAMVQQVAKSEEVKYVKKYHQSSEEVRAEYIRKLEANSYQGGMGHRVNVTGYNEDQSHHWVLRCESYAYCVPTERELDAFRVIRGQCAIAEKPHSEVWGN